MSKDIAFFLWKDHVERHQLPNSVFQLVSVRTIGAMETKLLAPIHSVNCSHGNSILCIGKIRNSLSAKFFHLWHFGILFCSTLQKRRSQVKTNRKHLEFSPCKAASIHLQLEPGGDPLISPLIRFCRHSTSGNSPTFCPDPLQRLGEETSRFFGINSRSFYFQFFLLRDLQAVTFS